MRVKDRLSRFKYVFSFISYSQKNSSKKYQLQLCHKPAILEHTPPNFHLNRGIGLTIFPDFTTAFGLSVRGMYFPIIKLLKLLFPYSHPGFVINLFVRVRGNSIVHLQ